MKTTPTYAEQTVMAARLERLARERLGLPADSPIRRDIERLTRAWEGETFARVKRAMEQLLAERERERLIGERVPPPDTYSDGILVGWARTPGGARTPVRIPPSLLCLGTLIVGLIGRGKTFLMRQILSQLILLHAAVRIMCFDPNQSYRTCRTEVWNVPCTTR